MRGRELILKYEYSSYLEASLDTQTIKELKEMVTEITESLERQRNHPYLGKGEYRILSDSLKVRSSYKKKDIVFLIVSTLYRVKSINKRCIDSEEINQTLTYKYTTEEMNNLTEEGRRKLVEMNTGKTIPSKTRKKMSEAKKQKTPPVYWYNLDTGAIEICWQIDLVRKYDLSQSQVSRVQKGEAKACKGWTLLSNLTWDEQKTAFAKWDMAN